MVSQLARAVGVWVEDVERLIRRRLLPPVAGAVFNERHLATLRLVVRMRMEHRLSLDTISAILVDEYHYDLDRAERALLAFVDPDPSRAGIGPVDRTTLRRQTGIEAADLERLVRMELLPDVGPYGGHHRWMCQSVAALRARDMSDEELESLLRDADALAELETGACRNWGGTDRVEMLEGVRRRRRAVGDLAGRGRYVGQRRRLGLLALAAGQAGTLASVRFYRPSPLFCVRHGVDSWAFEPTPDGDSYRVGRLALGLGRTDVATVLLEDALRRGQGAPALVSATLAVGRALRNDQLGARNAVLSALQTDPEHAVTTAYCALALAISAPSTTSALQSAAWMEYALQLLERSRDGHTQDAGQELEAALARGRLGLVVPAALDCAAAAREDLEHVRRHTQHVADAGDGQLERQLLRINALYFLGMDLDSRGRHTDARPLLAEVAWIDPTSEFARQSWLRLQAPNFS